MKNAIYFLAAILIFLATSACDKGKDDFTQTICQENGSKANLRIKNISEYDFEGLVVNAYDSSVDFGSLDKGEYTCYTAFETLYTYAYIEVTIEGETLILQPIDFVGEIPLDKGHYAYLLNISESTEGNKGISLQFVEE